jgi:hypothetical protein
MRARGRARSKDPLATLSLAAVPLHGARRACTERCDVAYCGDVLQTLVAGQSASVGHNVLFRTAPKTR